MTDMTNKKHTDGSDGAPKVCTMRLKEETISGINEMKQTLGASSLDEALRVMLNSFSLTAAKDAMPERRAEIMEFETLCRRMANAYMHSLILYDDVEKRTKEMVKDDIVRLNKYIDDLQAKREESEKENRVLVEKYEKMVAELRQVKAERDALSAELEVLKKSNKADIDIVSRFDGLQKQLEAVLKLPTDNIG